MQIPAEGKGLRDTMVLSGRSPAALHFASDEGADCMRSRIGLFSVLCLLGVPGSVGAGDRTSETLKELSSGFETLAARVRPACYRCWSRPTRRIVPAGSAETCSGRSTARARVSFWIPEAISSPTPTWWRPRGASGWCCPFPGRDRARGIPFSSPAGKCSTPAWSMWTERPTSRS